MRETAQTVYVPDMAALGRRLALAFSNQLAIIA